MINLSKAFNKFKQAEVIAHYWHLNTVGVGGYAKHGALGNFYESLQGLNDSLAEKVLARMGGSLEIPPAILLNVSSDAEAYLRELGDFVDVQIKLSDSMLDIQDVLLDIRNLVNQTLFMLRMQ